MSASEIDPRVAPILSPALRQTLDQARRRRESAANGRSLWAAVLNKEMAFERAFLNAGGTLLAGSDPTRWGGILAGFGDQRGLELLVAAGLTPEIAVKVATSNGASFLDDRSVGRIEPGRQADLVVVRGDAAKDISAVRNVELVFKDGIAYEPEQLLAAAAGTLEPTSSWSRLALPGGMPIALFIGLRLTRPARRKSR